MRRVTEDSARVFALTRGLTSIYPNAQQDACVRLIMSVPLPSPIEQSDIAVANAGWLPVACMHKGRAFTEIPSINVHARLPSIHCRFESARHGPEKFDPVRPK